MSGKGHKIVNVQEKPPREVFTYPESGDGNQTFRFLHKGEPIACFLLAPDPGKKSVLCNMGAKLPHYWVTSSYLCIRCGDVNGHVCSVTAPNDQFNRESIARAHI